MKPIPKYLAFLLVIIGFYACASTGMPDGGPYDETPPKFVRATPEPNATNNKRKKISIEFDEYIKLDNASEKVIISPPQKEAPEVKVSGHRVLVQFFDTLQENTTYTVDFGDAIVENNEDNQLGNFAYEFSTFAHIDSILVACTVLIAESGAGERDSGGTSQELGRQCVCETPVRPYFAYRQPGTFYHPGSGAGKIPYLCPDGR